MSTTIRPDISKNNEYWIGKHRYYELKHFCMQYPEWKKLYLAEDGLVRASTDPRRTNFPKSPTELSVYKRLYFLDRMKMLETVATETHQILGNYILDAVIRNKSYDTVQACIDVPVSRNEYYKLYRRFFYILDRHRK